MLFRFRYQLQQMQLVRLASYSRSHWGPPACLKREVISLRAERKQPKTKPHSKLQKIYGYKNIQTQQKKLLEEQPSIIVIKLKNKL